MINTFFHVSKPLLWKFKINTFAIWTRPSTYSSYVMQNAEHKMKLADSIESNKFTQYEFPNGIQIVSPTIQNGSVKAIDSRIFYQ